MSYKVKLSPGRIRAGDEQMGGEVRTGKRLTEELGKEGKEGYWALGSGIPARKKGLQERSPGAGGSLPAHNSPGHSEVWCWPTACQAGK